MAKLKTHKCPSCSAPIEVAPEQSDITCRYCGNSIHVERKAAPRSPGPGVAMNPHVMYIDPRAGVKMARIFTVIGLLPLLIPVGIFVVPAITKMIRQSVKPFPAHCAVNERLELSGLKYEGTGPLVMADTNCNVTISKSSLKGSTIVSSQGSNVKVTIQESTIDTKDSVVELGSGLNSLRISGKSTVTSEGAIALVKGNAEVVFEDSTIKAKDVIVRGESNVKVSATRSELSGREGFILGTNADITLKAGTATIQGTAASGDSNTKFSCDGCVVEAADVLRAGSSAKVRVANKGRLTATGTAIETKSSPDIEIDDSRVESKDLAIASESSLRLRASRQSLIKGGRVAIRAESSGSISLRDSTVEGGTNAIEGRSPPQIDAVKSTIRGGSLAFAFRSKPSQLSLTDTNVIGGQNFATDIAPRTPAPAPAPATGGGNAVTAKGAAPARGLVANAAAPAKPPPFDGKAAAAALDAAEANASTTCRSSSGKVKKAFVDPGFVPDGTNAKASVRLNKDIAAGTPEVACIERVFRAVRIAAFDESTRPSGLMRAVNLKP